MLEKRSNMMQSSLKALFLVREVKPRGADVPAFSSLEAYVSAAKSFWAPSVRHGILQGIRADGAILRFEPATGYFGVMRNGRISKFESVNLTVYLH